MRILSPLVSLVTLSPLLGHASTSLVDLLSASPDHSLLLRAFQRARLIPTLNRLNGSTLFAPTNEAIRNAQDRHHDDDPDAFSWSSLSLDDDDDDEAGDNDSHDNLQLALRETLLYHCLNYTLFPPPTSPNSTSLVLSNHSSLDHLLPLDVVTLQESLYFPMLSSYNHSFPQPPSLPGSEPDKPDPGAPPTDRPQGLLRGEGQKIRMIRRRKPGINPTTSFAKRRGARGSIQEKEEEEDQVWIEVDWLGSGGVELDLSRIRHASNGILIPLPSTTILSKPRSLAELVRTLPQLSTFASLLTDSLYEYLDQARHLTVFAPTNEAWSSLSELEMRYLRSEFSQVDLEEILGDSASRDAVSSEKKQRGVGYLDRLLGGGGGDGGEDGRESFVKTLRNGTLQLEKGQEPGEIKVNGTRVRQGDILAKNGVLHTLPSLLLPSGSLSLTSEKYLLALNCTKFVSLLHSVNLSHYVQIPSNQDTTILPDPLPHYLPLSSSSSSLTAAQIPLRRVHKEEEEEEEQKGYTILALKDSLLETLDLSSSSSSSSDLVRLLTLPSFPSPGSQELRDLLSYHVLPSKLGPKRLRDGMLVGTELRPTSLDQARQRLVVSVQDEQGGQGEGWEKRGGGNDNKDRDENEEVVIGFGNANAIAEPVEVGNSIIYLISTILEPPTSVISTAVTDLRLSTFIASVFSARLDKFFLSTPSITFLIPTNQAFEKLGLVMSYLLLPGAKRELESLLRYHALDEVVYEEDFPRKGSKRYPTLDDGSEIYLERASSGGGGGSGNSTSSAGGGGLTVHGPTLGGYPANGEERDGRILESDQLTSTGVLHVLDQVELPPSLDITVDKLMKGAKSTTMVELIREANMSWVLEGKEPGYLEDGSRRGRRGGGGEVKRAYTILCPTDKALSRLNLTYYLTHPTQLEQLIKLHIIPTDALLSTSSPTRGDGGGGGGGRGEEEGTPLVLSDSITYPTLHSVEEGGESKYGKVAFKRWGTERGSWMVGIEGARGTKGESDSARVVNWGRATPWIIGNRDDLALRESGGLRVAAGGGVILIDSVLLPYEPGWFRRWGWIALAAAIGTALAVLLGIWGVKKWRRRLRKNGEGYERVEGEED